MPLFAAAIAEMADESGDQDFETQEDEEELAERDRLARDEEFDEKYGGEETVDGRDPLGDSAQLEDSFDSAGGGGDDGSPLQARYDERNDPDRLAAVAEGKRRLAQARADMESDAKHTDSSASLPESTDAGAGAGAGAVGADGSAGGGALRSDDFTSTDLLPHAPVNEAEGEEDEDDAGGYSDLDRSDDETDRSKNEVKVRALHFVRVR